MRDFDQVYLDGREDYSAITGKPGLVADEPYQPAALFTLKVTRVSANINQALPFVLFGWQQSQSQYRSQIQNVLSGGTVFDGLGGGKSAAIADSEKVIFSFTNGADTDTVEIESQDGSSYPELLFGSGIVPMRAQKVRISLSDETKSQQFSERLQFGNKTLFGLEKSQSLTPNSQKSPNQFQAGIIDLLSTPVDLGASVFLQSKIIAEQSFSLALTFEVSSFTRPLKAG